jgi:CRP-like cAMP-binding protein
MGDAAFRVFGLDRQLYGPVTAGTLLEWAQDGRVQRDTWIHSEGSDGWQRAGEISHLKAFFTPSLSDRPTVSQATTPAESRAGAPVKALTRLRVFADMSPAALEPFARHLVEESFRPFTFIVQQGSHGDAMYFVMQGKVGVSTKGQVSESFLVALNIGDTFGEMSLFDPGPRSADVRAENDVVVLKLTSSALQSICAEAPTAANQFLWNVARLLSARVRSMDRRTATAKDLDATGRAVQ